MAKTYEVGDGTCTFGVFSTESKAKAHLKKLKAEGKRAKIYVNHDAPDAPKDETGSKKKASKPKTPKRCTVAADSVRSCCETGVEVACEEMGLDHAYYHVQTEKGTDGSVDVRVADEQGNTVMFTVVGKADGFEVRVFKNNGQIMKRLQFPEDGLCDGLKGVAFGSVEALNRKFPQKRPKKAPVKPKAPKKKVTKPKPRNAAAGKGQYSASYYEKLERELKRAEKEGDNDAIIAITREIAESLSAEGEEIPDARAYLDDSDYGELARNSRWKYDSRETNRRYLKKIRDEQAMYGNANRKKMGGRRR